MMDTLEILSLLRNKVKYWETVCSANPTAHSRNALIDFRHVVREIEESLDQQADDMWAKEKGEASHL